MTVVVFKSKSEVFSFLDEARASGIGGTIVSTPKEVKIGCGLAVNISDNYYSVARQIVIRGDYGTFHGIFRLRREGLKTILYRLG